MHPTWMSLVVFGALAPEPHVITTLPFPVMVHVVEVARESVKVVAEQSVAARPGCLSPRSATVSRLEEPSSATEQPRWMQARMLSGPHVPPDWSRRL